LLVDELMSPPATAHTTSTISNPGFASADASRCLSTPTVHVDKAQ